VTVGQTVSLRSPDRARPLPDRGFTCFVQPTSLLTRARVKIDPKQVDMPSIMIKSAVKKSHTAQNTSQCGDQTGIGNTQILHASTKRWFNPTKHSLTGASDTPPSLEEEEEEEEFYIFCAANKSARMW